MTKSLDENGQPKNLAYNASRRITRAINELLGFIRGIIADDYLNEKEANKLAEWMMVNHEALEHWPINVIAQRLNNIYADGVADEEERSELADLIRDVIGKSSEDEFSFGPTDLPLSRPEPEVIFDLNEFVFTGRFMYGTRKSCQRAVLELGGKCADNIRLQTNYLVIGALTSRDWKYTTFGNKIAKAVEYQQRCGIYIISEKHWEKYLLGRPVSEPRSKVAKQQHN